MNLLTEAEARARLGGIGRTSLWKWYGDCRVAVTPTRRPLIKWDAAKLEARQRELQRAQKRITRAAS